MIAAGYRHALIRRFAVVATVRRTYHSPAARMPAAAAHNVADLEDAGRVLCIQSHVVYGYVGSKCAVFPLQLLGFDVDPIFSVNFSNHTGYPSFKGDVYDGKHLAGMIQGLQDNKLLGHTHLLTGYIGSVSLLKAVADVSRQLKAINPGLTYVCDPVMGDEGRLYCAPEIVDAFKSEIVPLASVLVPNQFEAELLTGVSIKDEQGALDACRQLHEQGPHTVVITSLVLPSDPDHVTLIASTTQEQAAGPAHQALRMRIPRIKAYFTGTGDLLAALLLANLRHHPGDLAAAVDKAIGALQAVLQDTAKHCGDAVRATDRTAEVCRARELRIIQNQQSIRSPAVTLHCVPLGGSANGSAA